MVAGRAWGLAGTPGNVYAVSVTPVRRQRRILTVLGSGCLLVAAWGGVILPGGCGAFTENNPAPMFAVPLIVEGKSVGSAIIDTGGGYEVMLRDAFGLEVTGRVEVLAFGGREVVDVTEGFAYSAGGVDAVAEAALIGVSVCDCNGLGVDFLRKTGVVLAVDFPERSAAFLRSVPTGGQTLDFAMPPSQLAGFDSAFVEVRVSAGRTSRTVRGLVDTGSAETVMRRGLVGSPSLFSPHRMTVRITHDDLGSVTLDVGMFDTPGLPSIILGTDAMRAWAGRWYFSYAPEGGTVTVFPDSVAMPPLATEPAAARRF